MAYTPLFTPAPVTRFTRRDRPGGFTLPASYAPQESSLFEQGEGLRRLFDPRRAAARGSLAERLAGFGGYRFQTDNPSTPEDESLIVEYDADQAGRGPQEREASRGVRDTHAARGTLHSSFAQRDTARILGELARQARSHVAGYQNELTGLAGEETAAGTGIYGQLAGLYGDAARQAVDAPPPPPEPAPAAAPAVAPSRENNYGSSRTEPIATYAQWLRAMGGLASSAALANRWREYVRRAGGTPPGG